MRNSSSKSLGQKSKEPKKSSKLTSWPSTFQERKHLYEKYAAQRGRLSFQFLDLMMKGEDIFKGISKQVLKRAYSKANALGNGKHEGLITRPLFPYFLKFLNYFTDIWRVFDNMDDEKINKLSKDKFVRHRGSIEKDMTKLRAEELFKNIDKDGTGSLSFDEFCNWAVEQETFLGTNNKQFFDIHNHQFEETAEDEDYTEEKKSDTDEARTFHSLDDLDEPKSIKNELEKYEESFVELAKTDKDLENLYAKIEVLEDENKILKKEMEDQLLKLQLEKEDEQLKQLEKLAEFERTKNESLNREKNLRDEMTALHEKLQFNEDNNNRLLNNKEIEKNKIIEEINKINEECQKYQGQFNFLSEKITLVSDKLFAAEDKIQSLSSEKESYILMDSELTAKIRDFYNEFNQEIEKEFKNLEENFNLKILTIEDHKGSNEERKKALGEIETLKSYQHFLKLSLEKMREKEENIFEMERLKDDLIKKNEKMMEDYQNLEEKLKASIEMNQREILKNKDKRKSLSIDNDKKNNEVKNLLDELKTKEEAVLTLLAELDTIKIRHLKEIEILKESLTKNADETLKHEIHIFSEKLKLSEGKIQSLLIEKENKVSKHLLEFEALSQERDQLKQILNDNTQLFQEKISHLSHEKSELENYKQEHQELRNVKLNLEKRGLELENNLKESEARYLEIEAKLQLQEKKNLEVESYEKGK